MRRVAIPMRPISVITLTQNEEAKIGRCLESVRWADEIVVVDSFSQDRTVEICREYTDRVIQREYRWYSDQITFAIQQARNEWVFILDADEEATPELCAEIRGRVTPDSPFNGFYVPRKLMVNGRWMRFGGQYPDAQLRLFARDLIQWSTRRVHAPKSVPEPTTHLQHALLHYSYDSLSDLIRRLETYSNRQAHDLFHEGRRVGCGYLAARLGEQFVKRYVLQGGFRDGTWGLILAASHAYYVFAVFAKVWERQQTADSEQRTANGNDTAPDP